MNVIIVEDDPMLAALNEKYLSGLEGIQVAGRFSNGAQALEYLKKNPVELAVVDVYMPTMNGLELLRAMRGAWIQTAVIMITAATQMDVVEQCLHLGIEDYIIKPFSYPRLGEAVQRYQNKAMLVRQSTQADQAVVDQLLRASPGIGHGARALPKGLNAKTLASIQNLIQEDPLGAHTCGSISAESGLSKVTVRNYLNYLIETGVLRSSIDYETGGRPRVLYRLRD